MLQSLVDDIHLGFKVANFLLVIDRETFDLINEVLEALHDSICLVLLQDSKALLSLLVMILQLLRKFEGLTLKLQRLGCHRVNVAHDGFQLIEPVELVLSHLALLFKLIPHIFILFIVDHCKPVLFLLALIDESHESFLVDDLLLETSVALSRSTITGLLARALDVRVGQVVRVSEPAQMTLDLLDLSIVHAANCRVSKSCLSWQCLFLP